MEFRWDCRKLAGKVWQSLRPCPNKPSIIQNNQEYYDDMTDPYDFFHRHFYQNVFEGFLNHFYQKIIKREFCLYKLYLTTFII